jgi:muramoyltetrapeptide carboxypeptidase
LKYFPNITNRIIFTYKYIYMPAAFIKPPFLVPGDEVAIVSPSYTPDSSNLENGIRYLGSLGLKVRTGRSVTATMGPFAGPDSDRLSDLNDMIGHHGIKAIFASRGGYGLSRIIDSVNFDGFRRHPKWIIGYSDITVLHLWVNNVLRVMTLHAEMPVNYANRAKSAETFDTLRRALFGERLTVSWQGESLRGRDVTGVVAGGNLSLLYSLTGTAAFPSLKGKILFIEDIGEKIYHIDRMMFSLRLAGALEGLAALVVGGMNEIEDTRIPMGMSPSEIIGKAVEKYDFPVFFGFPAGHTDDNRALIMGSRASITCGEGLYSMDFA